MDTLGGYRLLRRLGSGPRADIWLGHDGDGVAAVKVFHPDVERASIDTEIEALGRASSRHLVHLNDLATVPVGLPCLILQRLSPVGLGRILAQRVVSAGEAVTIMAPLALAVAELHRVGVAHGGIGARSVLFDEHGAPVLSCFGASSLVGTYPDPPNASSLTVAQLAAEADVASDLQQLAELTRRVLLGVDGSATVSEWMHDAEPSEDPSQWPVELADRLFRLAEPTAVMAGKSDTAQHYPRTPDIRRGLLLDRRGGRGSGPGSDAEAHDTEAHDTEAHDTEGTWSDVLALPPSVARALTQWRELRASEPRRVLAAWTARIRVSLGRVRRRVWVLAAIVGAVVVAGALALSGAAAHESDAVSVAGSTQQTAERHAASSASQAGSSASAVTGSATGTGAAAGALRADPVVAGRLLLTVRRECLEQLSVLCLDRVDQAGSGAMDADSNMIRLAQQGGVDTGDTNTSRANYVTGTVELVERFGDTALLNVTVFTNGQNMPAASLLLVKGEAGWLIRDLVAADGAVADSEKPD